MQFTKRALALRLDSEQREGSNETNIVYWLKKDSLSFYPKLVLTMGVTILELLYQHSPTLKRAHSYALKLTSIFNTHCDRKSAMARIARWIQKVEKSDLTCFDTFIATLEKYKPYIANYFKQRKNSGFVEGLNNKIKVAKRRCYGFSQVKTIFQRLFLDLQGFEIYA